jgi:hypothetical protein
LEHGDDTAIHVGEKGGLHVGQAVVAPAPAADVAAAERQWLHDIGVDWDGESA